MLSRTLTRTCRTFKSPALGQVRHASNNGLEYIQKLKSSASKKPKLNTLQSIEDLLQRSKNAQPKKNRHTPKIDLKGLASKKPQKRPANTPSPTPSMQAKPVAPSDIYKDFNPETFKYNLSTSQRENEFMTEKIKKIHSINSRFDVMAIGSAGLERMKLKTFIKRLEEDELFDVVDVQEIDDVQYPVVRPTNKVATLKTFSDKKAEEVTKLYGRTREKKRDSNMKFIKVSWEISQTDLENQKTNEIMAQLKKGYKLTIAIDTRDNLNSRRDPFELQERDEDYVPPNLPKLELLRREKAFEYIQKLLGEGAVLESTSGSINEKIILVVSPKPQEKGKKEEQTKKLAKNEKKAERLAKQKKREEEKRLKQEAKMKQLEETMSKLS